MMENQVNNMEVLNFPILAEEIIALPSKWDFYPILWEEIEPNTASSPVAYTENVSKVLEQVDDTEEVQKTEEKPKTEENPKTEETQKTENWEKGFVSVGILKNGEFTKRSNGLMIGKKGLGRMGFDIIKVKGDKISSSYDGAMWIDKSDVLFVRGVFNDNPIGSGLFGKIKIQDRYSQIQVFLKDIRWLVLEGYYISEKQLNKDVDSFREAIK